MYPLLVLMALAWPLIAAVAAASILWGLIRLAGGPGFRARAVSRSGSLLSAGAAAAAIAAYGYGLGRTTSLSMADAEDRCAMGRAGPAEPLGTGGSAGLWPLHDTTCGSELVPSFVNPTVVVAVGLCAALIVLTAGARRRQDQPPR
jgi:hypothetical protein